MALVNEAKAGNAKLYLQFGGQGAPWYKELSKYYAEPSMKKFFDAALGAIDEERPRAEGTIGLPHGIDARGWLEDESKIPSEEYLGCAAVSIPMIQMTQLAHLENLIQNGFDLETMLGSALGATGHSQGLIPACLFGLGLKGDDYYEGVALFTKYLLNLGVSAQKAYPQFEPTADEIKESESLGGTAPAPMVAVLGTDHDTIQKLVDETNADIPESDKIYISLYNTPSNRILSAPRTSLIKFHEKNKDRIDSKEIKFVYLRTTCPFHCPHMEPVREIFEPEIKRISFNFKGADLKIPVISFYDKADMKSAGEDMPIKMYVDMAIMPLYWDKSMAPVAENKSITHVLDFGPGKISQRLSTEVLSSLGSETPVLASAVPKDLKEIL